MLPEKSPLNVLIVDDEIEACDNLRNLLQEYVDPFIVILGIANNTQQAERLIREKRPDAVFLDIEMPNENAFHFLQRISPLDFEVVFVTAYDEYAIRAFKLNAVDYILKPLSIPELSVAVAKVRDRIRLKSILAGAGQYADLSGQIQARARSPKITLRDNHSIEVVDFKDIYFVEAQGSYSRFLFFQDDAEREITMSGSLGDYEELFPEELFFRIHKSYLINCAFVKKLIRDDATSVVVGDKYTLPVSRRRTISLIEFLKNNHFYNE